MRTVILLLLVLAGIAFLLDQRNKRRAKAALEKKMPERIISERLTPADSMPPTETGRFRAQSALNSAVGASGKSGQQRKVGSEGENSEAEPLPDPFSAGEKNHNEKKENS